MLFRRRALINPTGIPITQDNKVAKSAISIEIALLATLLSWVIGIPVGLISS